MMYWKIIIVGVLLLGNGCSATKQKPMDAQEIKTTYKQVATFVQSKEFVFEADWAQPMTSTALNSIAASGLLGPGNSANAINLIGNSNFIRFKNDSVYGALPYFGERRMGGNYGGVQNGIRFEDTPETLDIKAPTQKKPYQLTYEIQDKENPVERYRIRMEVFPNGNCSVLINSNQRTFIRYNGAIEALQEQN